MKTGPGFILSIILMIVSSVCIGLYFRHYGVNHDALSLIVRAFLIELAVWVAGACLIVLARLAYGG
jgi:hypothetical protein